jgi:hypothetical protein
VWRPAFVAGLTELSATLSATPPTGIPGPLRGTPGTDWAGGVTAGGTVAYAASGSVDGQPYAGGLDAVVQAPQWTREFGTPVNDRLYGAVATADGGVIVAGYTRGDLDGKHPGSPADDGFVARFTATGERAWLTQLGDAAKADRFYGLTAAPDGGAYVAGYTSGALAAPSAGDKDVVLARIGADGTVGWTRQLGGAGEDKAYAVTADASGVYVAGVMSSDGFLAAFGVDGAHRWVKTDGDLFGGVAVTTAGAVVATGAVGGDALTTAYTSGGTQRWRTVSGGRGQDAGADVVALPGGAIAVVGFTGSTFGVPAGGADVFTVRLDGRGRQQAATQFGTARDDGVDGFGEENLYATRAGDRLLVTGLTSGDVFLTEVTP